MKRLLVFLLISIFTFSSLTAMVKEFRFRVYRVINGIEQLEGGVPISILVLMRNHVLFLMTSLLAVPQPSQAYMKTELAMLHAIL